jgi:hypothetical protein
VKSKESDQCLQLFVQLRNIIAEVEHAPSVFVEMKFGEIFLSKIKDCSDSEHQAMYMFALSDLVDVDRTGTLGVAFRQLGLLEEVLALFRKKSLDDYTNDYIAALFCAITSLSLYHLDKSDALFSPREFDFVHFLLHRKNMSHLHARCLLFLNNLYITGKFHEVISTRMIPATMTLLGYYITHHIVLKKKNSVLFPKPPSLSSLSISTSSEGETLQSSSVSLDVNTTNTSNVTSSQTQSPSQSSPDLPKSFHSPQSADDGLKSEGPLTTPEIAVTSSSLSSQSTNCEPNVPIDIHPDPTTTSHQQDTTPSSAVNKPLEFTQKSLLALLPEPDPQYDDSFYYEVVEAACCLLGNLTTSPEICTLVENFHLISMMALLFHNTDTTLEALTNVIKTLGNLANFPENRPKIMAIGILPIAVKLIQLQIDHEMKMNLALLFANMSGYESCTQMFIDGGVIHPLIELLETNNELYMRYATLALANLTTDVNAIPKMMNYPICLRNVVDLCYSQDTFLQRQAVRILKGMATYPTGAYWKQLNQIGAIDALKYVISHTPPLSETKETLIASSSLQTPHSSNSPTQAESRIPQPTIPCDSRSQRLLHVGILAAQTLTILQAGNSHQSPEFRSLQSSHSSNDTHNNTSNAVLEKEFPDPETNPQKAVEEKDKGNEFFRMKKYKEAVVCYTKAIEYDPSNHTYYSNRSAAYFHLDQFELALKDAEKCILLCPSWVKGHFRKGKALIGLRQYQDAINALKQGLKIECNKELQDALKQAYALQKEGAASTVPARIQRLNATQVMESLRQPNNLKRATHLLIHLFNLFKQYYKDIDPLSRRELMGGSYDGKKRVYNDADDIGMQLHNWATQVDLQALMSVPGMDDLIFNCDLVAEHIKHPPPDYEEFELDSEHLEDLSCYQFSYFVTTILARLVLQGHSKYGLHALKRLIQLDSDKHVRDSVGSPLTQGTLQVSGAGGWGLPKMPSLRQLFIQCGGLKCIALDSNEDIVFKPSCVNFLASVELHEWKQRPLSEIEVVIENFIIPSLEGDDKNIQQKAVATFGLISCLPFVREKFHQMIEKFTENNAFMKYVCEEFAKFVPTTKATNNTDSLEVESELDRQYKAFGIFLTVSYVI